MTRHDNRRRRSLQQLREQCKHWRLQCEAQSSRRLVQAELLRRARQRIAALEHQRSTLLQEFHQSAAAKKKWSRMLRRLKRVLTRAVKHTGVAYKIVRKADPNSPSQNLQV